MNSWYSKVRYNWGDNFPQVKEEKEKQTCFLLFFLLNLQYLQFFLLLFNKWEIIPSRTAARAIYVQWNLPERTF